MKSLVSLTILASLASEIISTSEHCRILSELTERDSWPSITEGLVFRAPVVALLVRLVDNLANPLVSAFASTYADYLEETVLSGLPSRERKLDLHDLLSTFVGQGVPSREIQMHTIYDTFYNQPNYKPITMFKLKMAGDTSKPIAYTTMRILEYLDGRPIPVKECENLNWPRSSINLVMSHYDEIIAQQSSFDKSDSTTLRQDICNVLSSWRITEDDSSNPSKMMVAKYKAAVGFLGTLEALGDQDVTSKHIHDFAQLHYHYYTSVEEESTIPIQGQSALENFSLFWDILEDFTVVNTESAFSKVQQMEIGSTARKWKNENISHMARLMDMAVIKAAHSLFNPYGETQNLLLDFMRKPRYFVKHDAFMKHCTQMVWSYHAYDFIRDLKLSTDTLGKYPSRRPDVQNPVDQTTGNDTSEQSTEELPNKPRSHSREGQENTPSTSVLAPTTAIGASLGVAILIGGGMFFFRRRAKRTPSSNSSAHPLL